MVIRKALANDINSVFNLICELENTAFDFEAFSEVYIANLNDKSIHYFLAKENDQALGFVSLYVQNLLHHCGKTGEIQELVIKDGYRSKGVGKLLLEKAEQLGTELGLQEIEVTSNKMRDRAHRFYIKENYADSHKKFTKKL